MKFIIPILPAILKKTKNFKDCFNWNFTEECVFEIHSNNLIITNSNKKKYKYKITNKKIIFVNNKNKINTLNWVIKNNIFFVAYKNILQSYKQVYYHKNYKIFNLLDILSKIYNNNKLHNKYQILKEETNLAVYTKRGYNIYYEIKDSKKILYYDKIFTLKILEKLIKKLIMFYL